MSNAIEIEAKALVTKKDYQHLLSLFKDYHSYTQTNYYVDTPDLNLRKEGIALRIREKDGVYEMTLKTPLSQGLLEKNCSWNPQMFEDFKERAIFPEGDIKRFLTMLDFDVDNLRIRTSLQTTRVDIPYAGGKLSIDENHYSNLVDYEIELEYNNLKDAERHLVALLEENKCDYVLSHKTKVTRALDAYQALKDKN